MLSALNPYKVDQFKTSMNPWVNRTAGLVRVLGDWEDHTSHDGREVRALSDTFTFWDADVDDQIHSSLKILEIAADATHAANHVFCYKFRDSGLLAASVQIWSEQLYIRQQLGPDNYFEISFKGFDGTFAIKQSRSLKHFEYIAQQYNQFKSWLDRMEEHHLITNLQYRRNMNHEVECDFAYKAWFSFSEEVLMQPRDANHLDFTASNPYTIQYGSK